MLHHKRAHVLFDLSDLRAQTMPDPADEQLRTARAARL